MAQGVFLSPEIPIFVREDWEAMRYVGSTIVVDSHDVVVVAPDGDIGYFYSMSVARKWARDKRRERR